LYSSETEPAPLQVQSSPAYGKADFTTTEIVLYSLFGFFPFDPENLKDSIKDYLHDKYGIGFTLSEPAGEEGRLRELEVNRQLTETAGCGAHEIESFSNPGPAAATATVQAKLNEIIAKVREAEPAGDGTTAGGPSANELSAKDKELLESISKALVVEPGTWEDVKPAQAPSPDALAIELKGSLQADPYKTGFNDFFTEDPFSGNAVAAEDSGSSSSSGGTITPTKVVGGHGVWAYKINANFKNLNAPAGRSFSLLSTPKYHKNKILLGNYWALFAKWNNEPENFYGENILLTNELLAHLIKTFWKKRVAFLKESYAMYFMFKVRYSNHPPVLWSGTDYATVNKMFTIYNSSEDNLNQLIKELTSALNGLNESYRSSIIIRSIICYKILPLTWVNESPAKNLTVIKELGTSRDVEKLFQSFELPANMNYKDWGLVTHDRNNFLIVENNLKNIKYIVRYFFNTKNILNYVSIEVEDINTNKSLFNFTDNIYSQKNNIFKRFINVYNHEYYYQNNEEILKIVEKKVSIIEPINTEKKIKNKFITLDMETQTINNELIPFTVCFYDGHKCGGKPATSFYLTDYKNSEEMLLDVIESLLKRKYNGYNVYCHNLSSFDGIFLFRL
jgi:hypothetical protein